MSSRALARIKAPSNTAMKCSATPRGSNEARGAWAAFALEIMKEAPLGQLGRRADLIHRRGGEPPGQHQPLGGIQQPLAGGRGFRRFFRGCGLFHTYWLVWYSMRGRQSRKSADLQRY